MGSSYIIVALICILVLVFNFREAKQAQSINQKSDRLYIYAAQITLFIGVLLRLIYLEYPYGINLDEAIAGYDAWCIAHYGVDQHLNSYPVYLKSWGSGQSALYAYLSAPFISLFGFSLPVHRLPMSIVSSTSLIVLYYTIRKIGFSKFFVFLAILFFVLNPWHLTKSRWALDCNLAPDFVLIGTCSIALAYYTDKVKKQTLLLTLGFISFGLAAYGYAVAWFMLPFYCLFILIFLFKKKRVSVKTGIIAIVSVLVVTFPLILFAFQLATGGDALSIGSISIPKLNEGRQETASVVTMSMNELPQYLFNVTKSLANGYDHLLTNSFPYTGQFYNPIGWIFILITFGFFVWKRKLNILDSLFMFWLIASIPITIFVSYNVNRWNMLWIPLIYFCVRGIDLCIAKRTIPKVIFYLAFAFLTSIFALNYKLIHDKAFLHGVDEAVAITSSPNIEDAYFSETIQYPAIMFYDPISPYIFDKTKVEVDKNAAFIHLIKFGKYTIGIPPTIEPKPKTAYVISNWHIEGYNVDLSQFEVKRNDDYTILWND